MRPAHPTDTTFDFKVGDYVVTTGGATACLGRVAEIAGDGALRICFTAGCTAELVSEKAVMPIGNAHVIGKDSIGFHRFRESCEERGPWCPPSCGAAGPAMAVSIEGANHAS